MSGAKVSAITSLPGRYRGVAVSHVDVPLDQQSLSAHSLPALRPTARPALSSLVLENAYGTALLYAFHAAFAIRRTVLRGVRSGGCLCPPALNGPGLCDAKTVDTAVPLILALARAACASTHLVTFAGSVVLEGRYHHVSFIVDAEPGRIHVLDVVPPPPPNCSTRSSASSTPRIAPDGAGAPRVVDLEDHPVERPRQPLPPALPRRWQQVPGAPSPISTRSPGGGLDAARPRLLQGHPPHFYGRRAPGHTGPYHRGRRRRVGPGERPDQVLPAR